jgi:anthranilate phosphoribosyltransferase
LRDGAETAARAIDSGAARRILDRLIAATNGEGATGRDADG